MSAKRFRLQAEKCAALAKQTHDQDSSERFLRLQQTYLQLAETETQAEKLAGELSVLAAAGERKSAKAP